jgi:hypothetical protein
MKFDHATLQSKNKSIDSVHSQCDNKTITYLEKHPFRPLASLRKNN